MRPGGDLIHPPCWLLLHCRAQRCACSSGLSRASSCASHTHLGYPPLPIPHADESTASLLPPIASSSTATTIPSRVCAPATWSPQQRSYRKIMRALRSAYYHDRAALFWARHRVLVEYYKYAAIAPQRKEEEEATVREEGDTSTRPSTPSSNTLNSRVKFLLEISDEVASFIAAYMTLDVGRINGYNNRIATLPIPEAKRVRQEYYHTERQHESWCKQRIKEILQRRPPPPYPFI